MVWCDQKCPNGEAGKDEDRWAKKEATNLSYLGRIVENESAEEEDTEDDEGAGDERDIWEVTHVTEQDFESTEGVRRRIEFVKRGPSFFVTVVFSMKVGDPITYV